MVSEWTESSVPARGRHLLALRAAKTSTNPMLVLLRNLVFIYVSHAEALNKICLVVVLLSLKALCETSDSNTNFQIQIPRT